MQRFLDHIQKSIYGPDYYRDLIDKPASFSWKYYWSLSMLLALFMTIVTSLPIIPVVNNVIQKFPEKFFTYYPDELEISIQKGHVTTNVSEPYFLALPPEWHMGTDTPNGFAYLGVIDTVTPVSESAWRSFGSVFWLTENALIVGDDKGGFRMATLGPETNATINETNLHSWYSHIEPYLKFIVPIIVVAIFVGMIASFTVNLVYLLFISLFVLLLGRVMKQGWHYGTAYRIALHATTLPLLITVLLAILPVGSFELPLFSGLLILAVVYMNFRESMGMISTPSTPPEVK